jgi:hypothetical protein
MSERRSFFANWGVKLLALLLAWGIWYVVREDLDEPRDLSLKVAIQVAEGAEMEAALHGASHVSVKLKGPRREVDLLASGMRPLIAHVRADDLAVDQNTGTRAFRAEDLVLPEPVRPGTVRIVEMDPDVVMVRLWRVARREVPLKPPEFPGTSELNVQVERRRWPQKAVVRGPAEELDSHLTLRTAVDREQLRRFVEAMGDAPRTTVTLPLTILDVTPGLLTVIEPKDLEVTADLVRNGEASVQVPLSILRAAEGPSRGLQVVDPQRSWFTAGDPPTITLEMRGNPLALATVTPQTVRAFLLESELAADATEGELRVHTSDLPSGVVLSREDLVLPVRAAR